MVEDAQHGVPVDHPALRLRGGGPRRGRQADTKLGAAAGMSPLMRQRSQVPPPISAPGGGSRYRPVMLATLAVPFDPDSARVAIQAAMEGGVKLLVVDAVEMPFWP